MEKSNTICIGCAVIIPFPAGFSAKVIMVNEDHLCTVEYIDCMKELRRDVYEIDDLILEKGVEC